MPDRPVVVFGDDGSPPADVAWLWTVNHRWEGWQADVVTATAPTKPPAASFVTADPEPWLSPHSRVAPADAGFAQVRTLSAPGDPRAVLCHATGAALLVLGTRGFGRARGVLLGSTTQWLLHHPPSPMAIVRSARRTRRVLACVDGSAHSEHAIEAFVRLPWAVENEVTALAVADGRTDPSSALDRALALFNDAGIVAKPKEEQGPPTDVILSELEADEVDLVVLGTRGLMGWDRLRLGSTASAVAQAARCTALVACVEG